MAPPGRALSPMRNVRANSSLELAESRPEGSLDFFWRCSARFCVGLLLHLPIVRYRPFLLNVIRAHRRIIAVFTHISVKSTLHISRMGERVVPLLLFVPDSKAKTISCLFSQESL